MRSTAAVRTPSRATRSASAPDSDRVGREHVSTGGPAAAGLPVLCGWMHGYAAPRAAEGDDRGARLCRAVARARALARRASDDLGAHGARDVWPPHVGHPADHG